MIPVRLVPVDVVRGDRAFKRGARVEPEAFDGIELQLVFVVEVLQEPLLIQPRYVTRKSFTSPSWSITTGQEVLQEQRPYGSGGQVRFGS